MLAIEFVASPGSAGSVAPGTRVVVLDETWSSAEDGDPDVVPIHRILARALVAADGFQALPLIDDWAEAAGLVDELTIDGIAWWYRIREGMVGWLHQRLIWRAVLDDLEGSDRIGSVRIPEAETALIDVARGSGIDRVEVVTGPAADAPTTAAASAPASSGLRGLLRRVLPSAESDAPTSPPPSARLGAIGDLDARVERLKGGHRLLVLSNTGIHEAAGLDGASRRAADPLLGPVIDRLRSEGEHPIVLALGVDHRDAERWAAAADDPDVLPASVLATRWGRSEDTAGGVEEASDRLSRSDMPRLAVGGCDFTDAAIAEIRRMLRSTVATSIRQVPRVSRALEELRPSAIVLTHEGIRTPWLIGARRAGIPIHAVQHGVIYPAHPGYRHPRDARWPLPDTTFVFGPYERDVLTEVGGYLPTEVEVSGSPRVDDGAASTADASERAAIRRELSVGPEDRLLLISTTFSPLGRTYLLNAFRAVLGGPLPGIHLLFKQHPGETDDGPYRALIEGMAVAGGWTAPRISVVRGRELYQLLHAADAHLGSFSTVLTDAVVTGTSNLIADTDPAIDVLGYVAAGVARPVGSPRDLLAALADGRPMHVDARAAFLERHFRPGDAVARIVARIGSATPV